MTNPRHAPGRIGESYTPEIAIATRPRTAAVPYVFMEAGPALQSNAMQG